MTTSDRNDEAWSKASHLIDLIKYCSERVQFHRDSIEGYKAQIEDYKADLLALVLVDEEEPGEEAP